MAAKIIPFPRFMQCRFTSSRGRQAANAPELSGEWDAGEGIHLVETAHPEISAATAEVLRESQREALRIVQEVQQEWNDRHHPANPVRNERPAHFWDALPMPRPQRETPLAVGRRLMHMLLSSAKTV